MNNMLWLLALFISTSAVTVRADSTPLQVDVHWDKETSVSKLHGAVQFGPEPEGTPMHRQIMNSLRDLQADFVRYVPWYPDPKSAVAQLYPPENGSTSWDFSLLDPPLEEFLDATAGHPPIINFSTIPEWMFQTKKSVDPKTDGWNYEQGTELRINLKELGDYYGRLVSWYTQGGFNDEYGKWHESGHHFHIPYWEVLNESDLEHATTPEQYSERYDAIVEGTRKVSRQTKFIGIALGFEMKEPKYFLYFLNHQNHRPGIPIDFVSYHFYAFYRPHQSRKEQIATVFDQADQLLDAVRYIGAIRDQFSPSAGMIVDEIGTGPAGWAILDASGDYLPFQFQLSTAMYAYLYGQLASLGVDAAQVSGLVRSQPGSMFQELAMLDLETGHPNTRYWGLQLLLKHIHSGDKLVATSIPHGEPRYQPAYAQGFLTSGDIRKLLLVNKRSEDIELTIPESQNARLEFVDQTTGTSPPSSVALTSDRVTLHRLAVAVVTFP